MYQQKPKFSKIYSKMGLKGCQKPKNHRLLAGVMPVYGPDFQGHCNITFSEDLVKKVGLVLNMGLLNQNPAFLVSIFDKKAKKWQVFARYVGATGTALLWVFDEFPPVFGQIYRNK